MLLRLGDYDVFDSFLNSDFVLAFEGRLDSLLLKGIPLGLN